MKLLLQALIQDTLMKDGRFSRTSLTMFSAWLIVITMAIADFIDKGMRYDVWLTLVGVATGIKILDSVSKKIK